MKLINFETPSSNLEKDSFEAALKEYIDTMSMSNISEASYLAFEKKCTTSMLNLFKEPNADELILSKNIKINPYIKLYKIPALEKGSLIYRDIVAYTVFSPSVLATGNLRFEYHIINLHGKFFQSLINTQKDKRFTTNQIISNIIENSNYSKDQVEAKIVATIRILLSLHFIYIDSDEIDIE